MDRDDTATSCPRRRCWRSARAPSRDGIAYRAKHLGLYQERTWAGYAQQVASRRARPEGARPRRRRAHRDHGRRLRGVAAGRPGRAGVGRHRLWHLSHRVDGRARIPDGRRRRSRSSSPKTRSTSTRSWPSPTSCPALRWIVVVDATAMFGYNDPKLKTFADAAGARRRARRGGSGSAGARHRPRGAGVHRLHLGHIRAPERRARLARQASGRRVQPRRALPDAGRAHAPHGRVPAAVPHPRARHRRDAAAAVASSCRTSARKSTTCRARCSRWRPPCCSPCRATCRSSRRSCWSASAARRPSSARRTNGRCGARATRRVRAGTGAPASRPPMRLARALVFKPMLDQLGLDGSSW